MLKRLLAISLAVGSLFGATAQVDSNFHIYLCLGQSNMEGNARVEPVDTKNVPERFKVMAAVDFANVGRTKGEWYTAVPPLVRAHTGLTPMDYFGRTMVANLPEEVTVGVIPVAVGGCRIDQLSKDFDRTTLEKDPEWLKGMMREYGSYPYGHIVELARKAQKQGVIKGILLHQGESNTGQQTWPGRVKQLYDDLCADLNLDPTQVPLIAGEVVATEMGGVCGSHNPLVNSLPQVIPGARVASAANLPQKGDGLHFTAHGYRVLGCRYATEMLATMGITNPKVDYEEEIPYIPKPEPSTGDFVFDLNHFNPQIWEKGTFDVDTHTFVGGTYGFGGWEYAQPIDLSGYRFIVAELEEPEQCGTEFRVFDTAGYWEVPYSSKFNGSTLIVAELDGMMRNLPSGIKALDTAKVYRVGFWTLGGKPVRIKHVYATNNNPYEASVSIVGRPDFDEPVYSLTGCLVAESAADIASLARGIYVCQGRKIAIL